MTDTITLQTVACGDVDALLALIARLSDRLRVRGYAVPTVMVCYEAGYEGFWLQRRLTA